MSDNPDHQDQSMSFLSTLCGRVMKEAGPDDVSWVYVAIMGIGIIAHAILHVAHEIRWQHRNKTWGGPL